MAAYVTFPGTAGDYVSTDDTNILTADTGHLQQGIGDWVESLGAQGLALSSDVSAQFGDTVLRFLPRNTGNSIINCGTGTGAVPISASTQYSVSVWVRSGVRTASLQYRTYQVGGTANSVQDLQMNVDASSGATLSGTFTSEGNAAYVTIFVVGDANADTTTWIYMDRVCLRTGSNTSFLPSLNVNGTLFETKNPAGISPVYTSGVDLTVGKSWSGNGAYYARHDGADASAPIVAEFHAAATDTVGDTDTWTDVTGRTWTVTGTGLTKGFTVSVNPDAHRTVGPGRLLKTGG